MRKARLALGIMLLGGLCICVALFWRGGGQDAVPAPAAPDATAEPTQAPPGDYTPPPAVRAQAAAPVQAAPVQAAPVEPTLSGTLLVTDDEGIEHTGLSGTLLVYPSAAQPTPLSIPVTAGRWSWARPGASGFYLVRVHTRVDGKSLDAIPLERECVASPGQPLEVRARWPQASVLSVRDADSLVELGGLTLFQCQELLDGMFHPAPDASFVEQGGASPLTLPRATGQREYWVRAPRYAWEHVAVDQTVGGEREVLLVRSAAVTVEVVGLPADLGGRIRLYTDESAGEPRLRARREPQPDSRASFDGLRPGAWIATVETGRPGFLAAHLAEAEFDLLAGESRHVVLVVDPSSLRSPAPLSGTLQLAQPLQAVSLRLFWSPAGDPPAREGDAGALASKSFLALENDPLAYAWDAGVVTPGTYKIVVHPHLHGVLVEVPDAGNTNVRLLLPELARIVVQVRERGTERSVPGKWVRWTRDAGVALAHGGWQYAGGADGLTVFHAAAGPITMFAGSRNHAETLAELVATPGLNELTIELDPIIAFEVILKDGDAVVPFAAGQWVVLRPIEGVGEATGGRKEGGRMTAVVERAGSYLLSIDPVDGFAPIAERRIEVPAGGAHPIVVQLERL